MIQSVVVQSKLTSDPISHSPILSSYSKHVTLAFTILLHHHISLDVYTFINRFGIPIFQLVFANPADIYNEDVV